MPHRVDVRRVTLDADERAACASGLRARIAFLESTAAYHRANPRDDDDPIALAELDKDAAIARRALEQVQNAEVWHV